MEEKELAEFLHNTYERLAVENNWKTQKSCQVCFDDLPEKNKLVMLGLATAILSAGYIKKSEIECDEEKLATIIHQTREWQSLHLEVISEILDDVKKGLAHAIAANLKSIIK